MGLACPAQERDILWGGTFCGAGHFVGQDIGAAVKCDENVNVIS